MESPKHKDTSKKTSMKVNINQIKTPKTRHLKEDKRERYSGNQNFRTSSNRVLEGSAAEAAACKLRIGGLKSRRTKVPRIGLAWREILNGAFAPI